VRKTEVVEAQPQPGSKMRLWKHKYPKDVTSQLTEPKDNGDPILQ